MEYGLRENESGMQSLCQGFYESFSVLSRISFFRKQLSYEISNIINNKISSELKSDLFLSNQHSVSAFFPSDFPLGQLRRLQQNLQFRSIFAYNTQQLQPSQTHPFSTVPSSAAEAPRARVHPAYRVQLQERCHRKKEL